MFNISNGLFTSREGASAYQVNLREPTFNTEIVLLENEHIYMPDRVTHPRTPCRFAWGTLMEELFFTL